MCGTTLAVVVVMGIRVEDAMTRDVFAVAPDTSLRAVAQLLALHGISAVPVLDDLGRPLGVVSKTDLLMHGGPRTAGGSHLYYRLWNGQLRTVGTVTDDCLGPPGVAADVMTTRVRGIHASADLAIAAALMATERIHRLLVLQQDHVIGVLSALDCVRELGRSK